MAAALQVEVKRGSGYTKDKHIADAVFPNLEKEQVKKNPPRYSDFRCF